MKRDISELVTHIASILMKIYYGREDLQTSNFGGRDMMIFDPKDWGINPDVEVGNDGFAYGNYVDWDSFRRENEEELLDYFGVDLPWGE